MWHLIIKYPTQRTTGKRLLLLGKQSWKKQKHINESIFGPPSLDRCHRKETINYNALHLVHWQASIVSSKLPLNPYVGGLQN